jgi:hypothetical protein
MGGIRKDPKERHVFQTTAYLNEYELQVLTALMIKTQSTAAEVIRQALAEMAERRLD